MTEQRESDIVSRQLARNYNTDEPGEQFHIVFQCVL